MSMTHTTIEAARDRAHWDTDKERQHGPSNNVVTVWDFDGGQSLELTAGELEEYEQAENVLLDEDVIGPERFANLLAWLRDEELLEQPTHGSPVTDEEMAQENERLLAQHTPGPWHAMPFNGGETIYAHDNHRVAECLATGKHGEKHEANARLIAAAPELLAALQNILAANPDLAEVADEARAAIAKATGGAQ